LSGKSQDAHIETDEKGSCILGCPLYRGQRSLAAGSLGNVTVSRRGSTTRRFSGIPTANAGHLIISDVASHRLPTLLAIDYAANHTVAPYFLSHRISPVDNLIVYDSEFESFAYRGLPPIRAAAPSLSTLGRRLAEKLVDRIRIGSWQEPQHELL
jgi:hypothetical protein